MRSVVVLPLLLAACAPAVTPGDPGPVVPGSTDATPPGITPDAGTPSSTDGGTPLPPDAGVCLPTPCTLDLVFPAAGASAVTLRGDFAPDGWSKGLPMTRTGDLFTVSLPFTSGQTVIYKFVADGTRWVLDPGNPNRVPDGFGSWNSVRSLTCGACPTAPATPSRDWRDAVLYFAFVDRFVDGDPTNNRPVAGVEGPANFAGGDLAGVKKKLDDGYFDTLGVTALWLTSPVDNTHGSGYGDDGHQYAAYHGYWPSDLGKVDARVGDLDTLRAVVKTAHDHGIRVLLDYVMNHVDQDSPVYAAHHDWFWPMDNCVCGHGCSWDTTPDRLRCWFQSYLPDFDFQIDAARKFSVDNAVWWLGQAGVDGFRLDAVKHIEPSWISDLRARVPTGFLLLGETYSSDRNLIRSFVDPARSLDGQFDFPLRAQILTNVLMRRGSMGDLVSFLDGNVSYYGPGAVMGTFLGNHDLPRAIHLAEDNPLFGEWDDGKGRAWGNQPPLPSANAPFERVGVAYGLLLTTPGIPLIYYGDEIGMAGAGDPDNRHMMSFTGWTSAQTRLHDQVARLGTLRKLHPALRRGQRTTIATSNDAYTYAMIGGGEILYVALNRGDAPQAAGLPPGRYRELVAGVDVESTASAPLMLAPRSVSILAAKEALP